MGVDNGALARRYLLEIWMKGNVGAIPELVDDEIVLRDPMTPDGVTGKAELLKRVEMMPDVFADITITIREVIVSADRVALCTTWRGVHEGDFYGVTGTGKTVTLECVEVLRIKQGKVIENVSYFDVYSMFQQIGALPPVELLRPREDQATSQTATA